jgi:hypothetical protein
MSISVDSRKQNAYRKAEDQFTRAARREDTFRQERAKADAADAAKVARLRNLRLAKEAADKQTAEDEGTAAIKTPARKRRRTITP